VSPDKDASMDFKEVENISRLKNVENVSGQIFGKAEVNQQVMELIGLDISGIRDRGWRLYGNWPGKESEIIAGINLRDALQLEEGRMLSLTHEGTTMNFVLTGFFEKGSAEDNAFILSLSDAWTLLGSPNKVSTILVNARPGELDTVVQDIRSMVPSVNVKTSRQIALAEQSLLGKMQLLMALVTLVVLFAAGISVGSTMGANVIERREEIGLMKAVGATGREITRFYRAEALLIGLLGGLAGYIFGYLFAQVTSRGAFGSLITVPVYTFVLSLVFGVLLSAASSYFPVRDALKDGAATILRGE
jgi:putative ABC transport system permease protein